MYRSVFTSQGDKKFTVLYAGSLGYIVDLMTVINAAKLLKESDDIVFIIAGDGEQLKYYQNLAKSEKLYHIKFLGQVTKAQAIQLCKICDVCVYALGDKPIYSLFLGNKVFDYLGSGKPLIFCGRKGDISDLINETNGGFSLDAYDYKGLLEKILYLKNNDHDRYKIGENAKRVIYDKYLTKHSMDKIYRVLRKVLIEYK